MCCSTPHRYKFNLGPKNRTFLLDMILWVIWRAYKFYCHEFTEQNNFLSLQRPSQNSSTKTYQLKMFYLQIKHKCVLLFFILITKMCHPIISLLYVLEKRKAREQSSMKTNIWTLTTDPRFPEIRGIKVCVFGGGDR